MAKQRLRGEGSISYSNGRGKWIARVWNPLTQRYIHSYVNTQREALASIKDLQRKQDQGIQLVTASTLMKDYLPEWLALHKNTLRPATYDGYEVMVRLYLIPRLGRYKLSALSPEIITRTWDAMIKDGHSATVVNHCQRRLSRSLNDAVRRNLISRNPCGFVTTPKIEKKEIMPLDDNEIQMLLNEAEGSPYHSIIFTALQTGMRRNELLGLQWKDIDLDLATIYLNRSIYRGNRETVVQTTKTKSGRRNIALSPQAVLFLRSELGNQIANGMFHGYKVDGESPVFRNTHTGKALLPNTITHEFSKIAKRIGLKNKFHDLRHTHATMLLKQGVNPKIVQERLGHSSIVITMDIYSHVMPNMQKDAIANFNIALDPVK
jgi:integrase